MCLRPATHSGVPGGGDRCRRWQVHNGSQEGGGGEIAGATLQGGEKAQRNRRELRSVGGKRREKGGQRWRGLFWPQAFEQNLPASQFLAHFRRHVIGRAQPAKSLVGSAALLPRTSAPRSPVTVRLSDKGLRSCFLGPGATPAGGCNVTGAE